MKLILNMGLVYKADSIQIKHMLVIRNISKQFPGVIALDNVQLSVEAGTVLSVIGENGAGKSTLMKILSGSIAPDEGEIIFNSETVIFNSKLDAEKLGIGIVYQELSLFNNLSVAQNLFAMQEIKTFGFIDDKLMNEKAKMYLKRFNLNLDVRKKVKELSISEQQMIEIAKVLMREPKLIILDEPTSSIGEKEKEILFELINELKKRGCAFIYISHKLDEVFQISDRISILRDGKYINTYLRSEINQENAIALMVGRDVNNIYPTRTLPIQDETMLECCGIAHPPYYQEITFKINKGEILGFYGLVGSGRTEIMKGIFGLYPPKEGKILIRNEEVNISSPRIAINYGIALVSENRKEEGLILDFSIKENISMVNLEHIITNKFLSQKKETQIADKHIKNLKIKSYSTNQIVNNLSGGNQQKIVLSKWFEVEPSIIILDEPTRGIDVGAKNEIYKIIRDLSAKGVSILLISSELSEIFHMSDRIMLVHNNKIIRECNPRKETEFDIMSHIFNYKEVA